MPNPNLSSNGLRSTTYRSMPVLQVPASETVRRTVTNNFLTGMSDIKERARQAHVPVIAPQFQSPSPRNVAANLRGFWTGTLRPLVVPARRHA